MNRRSVWGQTVLDSCTTMVNESEFYGVLGAFAFDAVALFALLVCWLFRDDMPFSEIVQFWDEIAAAIEETIPNSRVELLIADPKNEG